MDIASSVFSITLNIIKFISEHTDKDELQVQIADIIVQIQYVIKPLLLHDFPDEALRHVLQSLQAVLVNVDNHLRSWSESRTRRMIALVNPWAVTQEIREDRQQLMNQYQLLTGAIQTYDFIRGYNLLPPCPETESSIPGPPSTSDSSPNPNPPDVEEDEVLKFWHTKIGGDQEVVKTQKLCDELASWLDIKLKGLSRTRLLLRLDENNSGLVTLKTLQEFVRRGKLKDVILLYSSDPSFPLLIWISDDLKANARKAAFAGKKGVSVIQLASTTSAKAWIKVNKQILAKNDKASDLRFISDQSRLELDLRGKPFKNHRAGNEIIKHIRDEGFEAPVLIYTTVKTLPITRYVESYTSAGSIGDYKMFQNYVVALATRRNDDKDWMRCAAGS